MLDHLAAAIASMGSALDPKLIGASEDLYAPFHRRTSAAGVAIVRDVVYALRDRNRLDVFSSRGSAVHPILLFVHGGGFAAGDKSAPGSPYYDNVGFWATQHGCIGINMTYGLTPVARYPSGALDIASAIGWVRANAGEFGGDPNAIILMGQSAGAAHVATYLARPDLWPQGRPGIAGAVLLSGVYEFGDADQSPNVLTYFGDPAAAAAASPLAGIVAARIPLLFAVAEFDPPRFHAQAMQLAQALYARDARMPNVLVLAGHNHITEITHLNAPEIDDPMLSDGLADFIVRIARNAAREIIVGAP